MADIELKLVGCNFVKPGHIAAVPADGNIKSWYNNVEGGRLKWLDETLSNVATFFPVDGGTSVLLNEDELKELLEWKKAQRQKEMVLPPEMRDGRSMTQNA